MDFVEIMDLISRLRERPATDEEVGQLHSFVSWTYQDRESLRGAAANASKNLQNAIEAGERRR